MGYNLLQLVASYFVFPESHGLGLAKVDVVFETKGVHPVKMSKDIQMSNKEKAKLETQQDESSIIIHNNCRPTRFN